MPSWESGILARIIRKDSYFGLIVGFLLFAAPASAQVSITNPAANAIVSGNTVDLY